MRTATIKTGLGIQSCILQDYLNKFVIIINRTRKSTFVARNKNWRKRGVLPPLETGLYGIGQTYCDSLKKKFIDIRKCQYSVLIPCSTKCFRRFVFNKISLPERRNKRKSILEITKMYYFNI